MERNGESLTLIEVIDCFTEKAVFQFGIFDVLTIN